MTPAVAGLGPNEPLTVNERGGRQSSTPYRFDLLDAPAMFELAAVVAKGSAKYGVDNWRAIEVQSHVNHALQHLYAYLADDQSDAHLSHALCRCLFALAVQLQGGPLERKP